jgi:hypothetical protein
VQGQLQLFALNVGAASSSETLVNTLKYLQQGTRNVGNDLLNYMASPIRGRFPLKYTLNGCLVTKCYNNLSMGQISVALQRTFTASSGVPRIYDLQVEYKLPCSCHTATQATCKEAERISSFYYVPIHWNCFCLVSCDGVRLVHLALQPLFGTDNIRWWMWSNWWNGMAVGKDDRGTLMTPCPMPLYPQQALNAWLGIELGTPQWEACD